MYWEARFGNNVVDVWGAHKQKLYDDDSCPSPWLGICSCLELRSKGVVSYMYVPQVKEHMVSIWLYVHVRVAMPMIGQCYET